MQIKLQFATNDYKFVNENHSIGLSPNCFKTLSVDESIFKSLDNGLFVITVYHFHTEGDISAAQ